MAKLGALLGVLFGLLFAFVVGIIPLLVVCGIMLLVGVPCALIYRFSNTNKGV
jgi:hypothetical protein